MTENEILKYPKEDNNTQNLIGKNGENNLLYILVNPKENNEVETTFEYVEKIAKENGFNGWFIIYLYPKITNQIIDLESVPEEKLFWSNHQFISNLFLKNNLNFKSVLVAWGDEINSINHTYLKESIFYIYKNLEKHNLSYFTIGKNKTGNPKKLTEYKGDKIKKFNYEKYCSEIKKHIQIKPEIILNGYGFK